MKNLIEKLMLILMMSIINIACAQTELKNINNAKNIEINKKEYIGKPLSHLLKNIKIEIKSVKPVPNKNPNEINRITFRFVKSEQYRNDNRDITLKPTTITVVFNQNWELLGNRCRYDIPGCTDWTQEDKIKLGNLIINDIYVIGKN